METLQYPPRTANDYLIKALEMEEEAGRCVMSQVKLDFLDLARSWRAMARSAQRQDAANLPPAWVANTVER